MKKKNKLVFGNNEPHLGRNLENTVSFELYWAEFDHDDIKRETVGFSKYG
jgi:hypothetical protein